jgi:hypothetical protein
MNLAFKDADLAGGLFSKLIKWKTGGRFSHIELWMAGPREAATCFSSREPNGTGYATLDLSAPLWTCVEINATQAQMDAVRWFAEGTGFKRYDFLGILGFVLPQRTHDPACVFCSEWCCLAMQRCLGLFLDDDGGLPVRPWTVSPSDLYAMALERKVRE